MNGTNGIRQIIQKKSESRRSNCRRQARVAKRLSDGVVRIKQSETGLWLHYLLCFVGRSLMLRSLALRLTCGDIIGRQILGRPAGVKADCRHPPSRSSAPLVGFLLPSPYLKSVVTVTITTVTIVCYRPLTLPMLAFGTAYRIKASSINS